MRILPPFGLRRSGVPKRSDSLPARRRPRSRALIVIAGVGLLVAAGVLVWQTWFSTPAAVAPSTVPVTWGNLDVTISSSGAVQPLKDISLSFQAAGQVKEVLVKPGDHVRAGQPLARLDDQALQLQVQQIEADVTSAQANLDKAKNGSATPQDIAQSQADVRAAQAQLDKVRSGNTTAADLAEAQAALKSAQARLDALKNPSPSQVSSAQLKLSEAQNGLQQTRDNSSAAKTRAQLDMQQSTAALTQAQSRYATAKHNWDYVQAAGTDPTNPTTVDARGRSVANTLNDAQRQQYYDAFVQAEAALRSAEDSVAQAQVAYDNARQAEVTNVRQAEAQVRDAQQQLDALMHPTNNDIIQAQAAVDQQRANLQRLRQGGTSADIKNAQAQVDRARASLEALTAPTNPADIQIAAAALLQAQAKLDAAKADLANATLTAPFDGVIATVSVIPGSQVQTGSTTAALSMIDVSALYLELQVGDSDVMQVKPGQAVEVSFETVEDTVFAGTVESVAPVGTKQQNLTTYLVRVRFDPQDTELKIGLTGDAVITVLRRENVIQVPNQAIQGTGGMRTVNVQRPDKRAPETIPVQTGVTNGTSTEIIKCLTTNNQCLKEGDKLVISTPESGDQAGGKGEMIRIGEGDGDPSKAEGPPIPVFDAGP